MLIHDDVLHAGRMVHELLWRIYKNRYEFVGISCLFHRNEGETMFGLPVFPAVQTVFKAVHAEQCPDCTRGLPSTRQYGLAERTLRESWVDENLLPVADTTR